MTDIASIDLLIQAKPKDLGGFSVRRALPQIQKRMIGPFIFFDHMGPVDFQIGHGIDVRPHPHIGLSTLTYLFDGELMHRDTLGVEQNITPGAVNWMTAGSGVAHSERSSQAARSVVQKFHGIQTWIALPREQEEVAAAFHHHSAQSIPEISYQGSAVRVVAGSFNGQTSPVGTFSPMTYLDIHMPHGAVFEMEQNGQELGLYCVNGAVETTSRVVHPGELGVFSRSPRLKVIALETSRVLIVGGVPFPEERHIWWNFVSSSEARIERAKRDWVEQNFGKVRDEPTEFIPLPER